MPAPRVDRPRPPHRLRVADRAKGRGFLAVLDGALGSACAFPGARQLKADTGAGDDLQEPRPGALGVSIEAGLKVFGEADVMRGMPVGCCEVK